MTNNFSGALLIYEERSKQLVLGYNGEHDSQHEYAELAWDAARLTVPRHRRDEFVKWLHIPTDDPDIDVPARIAELVRAGALIAAEIDRLKWSS